MSPLEKKDIEAAIPDWIKTFGFKTLEVSESLTTWEITGEMDEKKTVATWPIPGTEGNAFPLDWPKRASAAYDPLFFGGPIGVTRSQKDLQQDQQNDVTDSTGNKIRTYFPHGSATLPGGPTIGIAPVFQVKITDVVGPASQAESPGGGELTDQLAPYGFNSTVEKKDGDHIREIQLSGPNKIPNMWPLALSMNRSSGSKIAKGSVKYPTTEKMVKVKELKERTARDYFFVIKSTL